MPLPYRVLVYLEDNFHYLVEIERLDLPGARGLAWRFHWLYFNRANQVLCRLEFVSMATHPAAEEREFAQGWLRFTAVAGVYQSYGTGQTVWLRASRLAALPGTLAAAVAEYLRAQ